MAVCVGCKHDVPVTASFCPRCGTPNPESPTIPTPTGADVHSGRTTERIDPDDLRPRLQAALGRDFVVGQLIGEGGFAVVFAAQDRKLSRRIAVKVLRPELTSSKSTVQRFVREAEAAANLNHPHILPIFFVGEGEGLVYFGMPYVEGETLESLLNREEKLSEAEARRIGAEIADALGEAHGAGLVHRDVKPANVLLQGKKRRVLVADFGIAKAAAGSGEKLTGTGVVIGSPHYMSPEQAGGSEGVDHRSDVYSLGVVLWQMLAGALPFEGPDSQGVLVQHLTKPLPPLRKRRADTSAEYSRIVERACAKKPAERFQAAAELSDALRGGALMPLRRPRHVPLAGAVVGVLLVVGGAVAVSLLPRGELADAPAAGAVVPHGTAPHVAVLPFEASDTGRGRDAARRLAARLESQFGVTTVDMNRLLPAWLAERRTLTTSLDSNAAFAWRMGANQVIVGNILVSEGQISVAVDLYDTQNYERLGHEDLDGSSLFPVLDQLANRVAVSLCRQPDFNPRNLCFDTPARAAPIAITIDSFPADSQHIYVLVGVDGRPAGAPRQGLAEASVYAAAVPRVATARFEPARKGGRPVEAWLAVSVVRAESAATQAVSVDCAEYAVALANEGGACYDTRPAPRSTPIVTIPASCRVDPRRVVVLVRVTPTGDVTGSASILTRSACPDFDLAATAFATDLAFTPAQKGGRPVETWAAIPISGRR